MKALVLIFLVSCAASTPVVQYAGIDPKQYVETKTLPDRPDKDPIPADKDWVIPLAAGQTAKQDGVLLSPEKAGRAKLWQDGYLGLRSLYDIDRQIWTQQRIIYDERLSQANAEIKRRSPSWWDENKGTLSWVGGFVMGAATSVAIVYGLEHVK
jgi:hypothetical protein